MLPFSSDRRRMAVEREYRAAANAPPSGALSARLVAITHVALISHSIDGWRPWQAQFSIARARSSYFQVWSASRWFQIIALVPSSWFICPGAPAGNCDQDFQAGSAVRQSREHRAFPLPCPFPGGRLCLQDQLFGGCSRLVLSAHVSVFASHPLCVCSISY